MTKNILKEKLLIFISGIFAGIMIGFGGFNFLIGKFTFDNPTAGAVMFNAGLCMICLFKLHLFTGKVCYSCENKPSYLLDLIIILISNCIGAFLIGLVFSISNKINPELLQNFIISKTPFVNNGKPWYVIFLMSILAGFCVYIAVEGNKTIKNEVGKFIAVILGITTMVFIGGEHSIANCFYYGACIKELPLEYNGFFIVNIIISIIGNSIGGLMLWGLHNLVKKLYIKKEDTKSTNTLNNNENSSEN